MFHARNQVHITASLVARTSVRRWSSARASSLRWPTTKLLSPTPSSSLLHNAPLLSPHFGVLHRLNSRQIGTLRSLLPSAVWAKIPKGFKRFYPEEGSKSEAGDNPKPESSNDGEDKNPNPEPSNDGEDQEPKPETPEQDEKPDDDEKQEDDERKAKKKKNKSSDEELDMTLSGGDVFIFLATCVLLGYYWLRPTSASGQEISYQQFVTDLLEPGAVERMVVDTGPEAIRVDVYTTEAPTQPAYYFSIGSVDSFERRLDDDQLELGIDSRNFIPVKYVKSTSPAEAWGFLFYAALLGASGFFMYRTAKTMTGGMSGGKGGRNIFSLGKSNAHLVKPEEGTKVTFSDVAGLDEAKVEIMEFVQFLKSPERFTRLGAKIPKGALLVGPPGTGKTLLAKAVAGEANVPFYSISGSDFIEMFVGVGPSRVRDLFETARKDTPCMIFIDEIDAVGRARSKSNQGGNDERENTLNQLLVEMDGFQTTEGIVVLAGTNRADVLDKALLRPGRFDRQISIGNPDIRGRTQILKVHLKPLLVHLDIGDLCKRLAALTPGMSGADLANVCNEAALIAARHNKASVELIDFESAIDRIIGGLAKTHSTLTLNEKEIVAYHEAGHAVVGWFLEHADPLLKVTIVPRGNGALGFAQYLPKELALYTTEQLNDMMAMALGGRAAEQVFFGKISTGAVDDLKKVNRIASSSVSIYGLSERLGNVSYQREDGDQGFTKPYSEHTAIIIDEEIGTLIQTTYDRTLKLVEEKRDLVEALAQQLLKHETINHDVIVATLGPRPFQHDGYKKFMEMKDTELRDATGSLKDHEDKADSEWKKYDEQKDKKKHDEQEDKKQDDQEDKANTTAEHDTDAQRKDAEPQDKDAEQQLDNTTESVEESDKTSTKPDETKTK